MSQEPMPAPDVEWVKVSGPEALAPLDRHWIRYLRVVLLAAAVLIAWRILAWQEDAYQLAAAAAAPSAQVVVPEAVTAPPIPETPAATATVSVVVISPTPTPTPPPTPTPTPARTPTPKTHRVRLGDTLSEIADFYGVTMDAILSLNNIPDSNNLIEGQALILPPDAERGRRADASGDVPRPARRHAQRHCREAEHDDRAAHGRQRHRRSQQHFCRASAERAGRWDVSRVGLFRVADARRLAGLAERQSAPALASALQALPTEC